VYDNNEQDEDCYPPQGGTKMSALWVLLSPLYVGYDAIDEV